MENLAKKRKWEECPHSVKCYRTNPHHFNEYHHSHLVPFIKSYGELAFPDTFTQSRDVYMKQLETLRRLLHIKLDDKDLSAKGVCIVKPFVYGNIARYFGKKREEDGHTHQWTVYVKPYNNEDMSAYVKKVHFKLHESYTNQNRIVVKPPYEISETGWGEFEIVIKIHFHDPNERPVTMYHILKLFHSGNTSDVTIDQSKSLVSENYDEIVFQDPTQLMQHLLTNTKQLTLGPWEHHTDFEERKHKTMQAITDQRQKLRVEIVILKNRLRLARETITQFKDEIARAQDAQYISDQSS